MFGNVLSETSYWLKIINQIRPSDVFAEPTSAFGRPNLLVTDAAWCLWASCHHSEEWNRDFSRGTFSGRMWHSIHRCFCTHPSPSMSLHLYISFYTNTLLSTPLSLSLSGPLWRPWKPLTFRLTMVDFLPAVALSFSLRGLALKHTGATISPPKSHCLAFVAAYWMRMPH